MRFSLGQRGSLVPTLVDVRQLVALIGSLDFEGANSLPEVGSVGGVLDRLPDCLVVNVLIDLLVRPSSLMRVVVL